MDIKVSQDNNMLVSDRFKIRFRFKTIIVNAISLLLFLWTICADDLEQFRYLSLKFEFKCLWYMSIECTLVLLHKAYIFKTFLKYYIIEHYCSIPTGWGEYHLNYSNGSASFVFFKRTLFEWFIWDIATRQL